MHEFLYSVCFSIIFFLLVSLACNWEVGAPGV